MGSKKTAAKPPTQPVSLSAALLGRDLPEYWTLAVLGLLIIQVYCAFFIFYNRPVPTGPGEQFFPANLHYQNVDVPVWLVTGAMLPTNAPAVRAMRPLYPFPITVAKWLGLVYVNPRVKETPPGGFPGGFLTMDTGRATIVLLVFNYLLTLASLWIFFAMCRRFGMPPASALMATLVAGFSFGFAFWMTKAVPEVFGYFAIMVSLAAIVMGFEKDKPTAPATVGKQLTRQAITWGCVGLLIGILLLGKEVFCLPMFAGLLLLFTRRWAGLVAFCVLTLLPTTLWNYYMSKIVGAFDPAAYLKEYKFIVWLPQELGPASWPDRFLILWKNLERQIICFFQAFAYVPVVLAFLGMIVSRVIPKQGWVLGAFFLSFYILFLASNFIMPRLLFMTWPVIYVFAWKAIEWIAVRIENSVKSSSFSYGRAFKFVAMFCLFYLGTRQQFTWYYYG